MRPVAPATSSSASGTSESESATEAAGGVQPRAVGESASSVSEAEDAAHIEADKRAKHEHAKMVAEATKGTG